MVENINEGNLAPEAVISQIPEEMRRRIVEHARELGPYLEATYFDFHQHPELGFEEHETTKKILEELETLGGEIMSRGVRKLTIDGREVGGTGAVAVIHGKEGGPTIALRADIDALPLQEPESTPHHSETPGAMHACGHDAHAAGLLGAAKIFRDLADKGELEGDVVLMFQPAEERTHFKESGAVQIMKILADTGLWKKIDGVFGIHVFSEEPRGVVATRENLITASSGDAEIILTSPGGHIMNAYELPNVASLDARLRVRLEDEFRALDVEKKALVASSGSERSPIGYNILPGSVKSTWVIRVRVPEYKVESKKILKRMQTIIQEEVEKFAATIKEVREEKGKEMVDVRPHVEVKFNPGYRPTLNDKAFVDIVRQSGAATLPNYQGKDMSFAGGEDFSFFRGPFQGKEVPVAFVMLGAANPEKGIPANPHHSPSFRLDTGVLPEVAALNVVMALNAFHHFKK